VKEPFFGSDRCVCIDRLCFTTSWSF
jgi:hypothetical protein